MQIIKLAISFLILCFLASCSFGPVAAPPITTYQLQVPSIPLNFTKRTSATLLVMLPTASAAYQTKAMIYSTHEYQMASFAKNQWVAAPAQMLLPLLVTRLNNLHYFHAVVPYPFFGQSNYRLQTHILEFQQNFDENNSNSWFRMTLQAEILNSSNRVIAMRRFQAVVQAPENNPYGGVVAANMATGKILQQVAEWCAFKLITTI